MTRPEGGLTNNKINLLEVESWNHRWTNELLQKGVSDPASLSSDLPGFDDLANLSIRVSNALLQFDNHEATLLVDFSGLYQEEPDELIEDEFSWAQIDGEHKGTRIYIDNGVGLDIGNKNSLLHRFFAQMNSIESNSLPWIIRQFLNLPTLFETRSVSLAILSVMTGLECA